jgi:hypothetical protein
VGVQVERAISTARLHPLRSFHLRPINVVVSHGPSGSPYLGVGFALRCFQRLSRSRMATRRYPWRDNRYTRACPVPGPLVLGTDPLKTPAPAADRDRTVSRRSEPSSRPPLMGEQPNPWDLLQPQDGGSRHRGTKPPRRCGLSGEISLLSPE